jgi:hypothetical protein
MKKHFALDIADGRFTFHRRQEEIAAEARLDGIYVIRTSLPADGSRLRPIRSIWSGA